MADKVREVIKFIGNGITEPLLCKLEDERYVVFKRLKNVESSRVLANELVSYHIAKELELPIPNAGCALVDEETYVSEQVLSKFDNKSDLFGLGFYSELREKVTQLTSPAQLASVINRCDIPRIIVFDHLLRNADRNPGNLLIDMKKGDKMINIIDHTHVFYLGPMWDKIQLERMRTERDVELNNIVKSNEVIYNIMIENYGLNHEEMTKVSMDFLSKLSNERISEIVNYIPVDWNISNEDKEELCRYLSYRLEALTYMSGLLFKGGE